MIDAPCKKCTERYSKCHSSCKKYINYKKKLETLKKIQRQERDNNYFVYDVRKIIIKKNENRKKKTGIYINFKR